jgi:hypothetical protein
MDLGSAAVNSCLTLYCLAVLKACLKRMSQLSSVGQCETFEPLKRETPFLLLVVGPHNLRPDGYLSML